MVSGCGRGRAAVWLALALIVVAGCSLSRGVDVRVDAIAAAGDRPAAKRYVLVPAADGVAADDLQFREFAGYVDRALAGVGYQPVAAGTAPDVVIALAYGVGEPQEKIFSYSIPEWGPWRARAPYPYGNVPTYRTEVDSYTTFARSLALTASAARDGRPGEQLWRAIAVSRGASEDLRRLFPVLLAALAPYLGRDTAGQVEVTVREDDPAVAGIKGAAAEAAP